MKSKNIFISLIVLVLIVTLVLSVTTYSRVDLASKGKQVESVTETQTKGDDLNKDLMDKFKNKLKSL